MFPQEALREENEMLRDENQNLRETLADALARNRQLEETDGDGAAACDSEDELSLTELQRRRAACDDDESGGGDDESESDEEAVARPRKRPRATAVPRARKRTSNYYGRLPARK